MYTCIFYEDYNIKRRHYLLARTIGAKQEEEASLSASNTLVITATIAIIVCSVLEVALYRLYNRKVDLHLTYPELLDMILFITVPPMGEDNNG